MLLNSLDYFIFITFIIILSTVGFLSGGGLKKKKK